MNTLRKILDKIPSLPLTIVAIMMALTPFYPQPHLVEKTALLFNGLLSKSIDIFDLFMHIFPLFILTLKLFLGKPNNTKSKH